MRGPTLFLPHAPCSVALTLAPMMEEREVEENSRRPARRVGLELVDAVPADPLLEWKDGLQTLATICAGRAPDRRAGEMALAPARASKLPAASTRNTELRVERERAEQAAGEVGRERDGRIPRPPDPRPGAPEHGDTRRL